MMKTVTGRANEVKQPYGGYIRPKNLLVKSFDDGIELHPQENISAALIGLAVDYLTRFMMNGNASKAFDISLKGAYTIGETENAKRLLIDICLELTDKSIDSACKLCGYDVCYRVGSEAYKPVQNITPNQNTISNIRTMVKRSMVFWDIYGPIVKDGFTLEGSYTDIIVAGDGDYITADVLWDFKVSKRPPTSKHTLQILIYYLMGIRSINTEFKNIRQLGIFNPRLNKAYLQNISGIDDKIIEEVSCDVIGYSTVLNGKNNITTTIGTTEGDWLLPDLVARYNVSRAKITSDFFGRGLPHFKIGSAYHFLPSAVIQWEIKQQYISYGKKGRIILPAYAEYQSQLKKGMREAKLNGDKQRIISLEKEAENNNISLFDNEDMIIMVAITITIIVGLCLLCNLVL